MAMSKGHPEMRAEYNREILIPGKQIVYQGRSSGRIYTIKSHYSESPIERADLIYELFQNYRCTFLNRDERMSFLRVSESVRHPRTLVLFARHEDIVIGHAILPRYLHENDYYMYSSRAIQKEYEQDGLGIEMWRIGLGIHRGIIAKSRIIRGILFMTQNAASVRSLEILRRSRVMNGAIYPFERGYDRELEAQNAMLAGHLLFRLTPQEFYTNPATSSVSRVLDLVTGVGRGELEELGVNEGFDLKPGTRTAEIHEIMFNRKPEEGGLGMTKKDVVWTLLMRKNPVNMELPLKKAA